MVAGQKNTSSAFEKTYMMHVYIFLFFRELGSFVWIYVAYMLYKKIKAVT